MQRSFVGMLFSFDFFFFLNILREEKKEE